MGVPYIVANGEAEALCVKLTKNGLAEGCLSEMFFGNRLLHKSIDHKGLVGKIRCIIGADMDTIDDSNPMTVISNLKHILENSLSKVTELERNKKTYTRRCCSVHDNNVQPNDPPIPQARRNNSTLSALFTPHT